MLFAIVGRLGDGKTLSLTFLTFEHWFRRKEKVFANYHLFKIPYFYIEGINQLDFIRGNKDSPTWSALDELWRIINARTPMAKRNQIVYDILGRSRKRHITHAFSSQLKRTIDRNVVDVLDFISKPTMTSDDKLCRLDIFMGSKASPATHINSPRFYTEPYMKCFDSITGDQEVIFFNDYNLHIEKVSNFNEINHKEVFVPSVNPKTMKMEIKKVKKFIKHFVNKDGYKITTMYGRVTKVTGDHSIFVLDTKFKQLNYSFKKNGVGIIAKPVRDLTLNDYVAIPKKIPIIEKDVEWINVAEKIMKKFKEQEKKYSFNILAKVSKKFMSDNHKNIKEAMKKKHGLMAYKRLYLMRKKLYVPYEILKDIGKEDVARKITSRYMKNMLNNKIRVDKDLLWLLGFFVAEGSGCSQNYYLRFYSEHKFIIKARKLMARIFGVGMKTFRRKEKRIWDLYISNRGLSILFQELTKDLSWLVQLPKHKLTYFLKGWWDGDGFHNGNANDFVINTSNENLINPLLMMLYRFGVVPSITRAKIDKKINYYAIRVSGIDKEKANDVLSWDKGIKQNLKARTNNDVVFAKIKKIEPFQINDYVYDFSVEDNHSFLAGNNLCHRNTDEEIDMIPEKKEEPKLIFQPNYKPEHGYLCVCNECGTKFFKEWKEADAWGLRWWEKNWKAVFPEWLVK